MKRRVLFFYIACVLLFVFAFIAPRLAIAIAKRSGARLFHGASINIRGCSLWPPGSCTFSGVSIERPGVYRFSVPVVTARANIAGNILVPDFHIDARAGASRLQARASVSISSWGRKISAFSLNAPRLEFSGGNAVDISIVAAVKRQGTFSVGKLSAGKLVAKEIKADTVFGNDTLFLKDLSGRSLGGLIEGSAYVFLRTGAPYQALIRVSSLDLAALINDLNAEQKIELSGIVKGEFTIQGSVRGVSLVSGGLESFPPGGVLNIRDEAVIDMIARRSGQARELISRSFTDYRYEQAQADMYTQDNRLVLDIAFQGEGGKRVLKAVLHDFTAQGGVL